MKLSNSSLIIFKLILFRNLMNLPLHIKDAQRVFGEKSVDKYIKEVGKYKQLLTYAAQEDYSESKSVYTRQFAKQFQILGLVKFAAITGSVAAGRAKENDDIDIFIVVKNYTSWIYRALLMIKMYRKVRHVVDELNVEKVKNKFCINFIVEERALTFEQEDIFTFHELIYMKPILNLEFINIILSKNPWLFSTFCLSQENSVNFIKEKEKGISFRNKKFIRVYLTHLVLTPLFLLNTLFMVVQIVYMYLFNHKPNFKRIFEGYLSGQIAFYPEGFKEEKIEKFEKKVEQLINFNNSK